MNPHYNTENRKSKALRETADLVIIPSGFVIASTTFTLHTRLIVNIKMLINADV